MTREIVTGLTRAYWMELETVMNYLANAVHLDGVRAEEIKEKLAADVTEELGHARAFAQRLKELGASVPGSKAFQATQEKLQPPADPTDVVAVIRGVIAAEEEAVAHYRDLIRRANEAEDYVTADLLTRVLADEESHRRQFVGFLKEYER